MSNESIMVVATKYLLKNPISLKSGTWDEKGHKEEIRTSIVSRHFVNERNSHKNNEIYVIDEEATAEMLIKRDGQIKANQAKAKRDKMSTADLVDAFQGNMKNEEEKTETKKPTKTSSIHHVLTKEDIDANPILAEKGFKKGDKVELDKEGNILF